MVGFIMQAGGYHSEAGVATQSLQAMNTIFYHLDKEYPKVMQELLEREAQVRQKKAKV